MATLIRGALLLATAALAAADSLAAIRLIQVEPGKETTVRGQIKGYGGSDYIVGLKAGDTLAVEFRSDSRSAYFNILPPGSEAAVFNGASEGGSAIVVVRSSGPYVVRVYLMRSAARRGEKAAFTLTIRIRRPF